MNRNRQGRARTPGKRLFIVGHKDIQENEYRQEFEQFGEIVDLYLLKKGSDYTGIAYITYSKISEAANAIENLNGKIIGQSGKYIKVLIASETRDGKDTDEDDDRYFRLFIMMRKGDTIDDIRQTFEEFGEVQDVTPVRNKRLCFVRYRSRYHAALAIEGCDPDFRAVFAIPKGSSENERKRDSFIDDMPRGPKRQRLDQYYDFEAPIEPRPSFEPVKPRPIPPHDPFILPTTIQSHPSRRCSLRVTLVPGLSEKNLVRLFDIIPGLTSFDYNSSSGFATVRYSAPDYAKYAIEKLDGFEYPLGHCLVVAPIDDPDGNSSAGEYLRAAEVLQQAGINPKSVLVSNPSTANYEKVPYCDVRLPPRQCTRPSDTPVAKRLFIVCKPSAIPTHYLKDLLCRFGDLIDIYILPGRNFGYAKFASVESADNAQSWLDKLRVCDVQLKVVEAEERSGGRMKEENKNVF